MRTLLKNVIVADCTGTRSLSDLSLLESVVIEDGRIQSIESATTPLSATEEATFDTIIDGNGALVLPGLIG